MTEKTEIGERTLGDMADGVSLADAKADAQHVRDALRSMERDYKAQIAALVEQRDRVQAQLIAANERAEAAEDVRDRMRKVGAKLGKLAEIICTDYSPSRKVLCKLDDARMEWDAIASSGERGK